MNNPVATQQPQPTTIFNPANATTVPGTPSRPGVGVGPQAQPQQTYGNTNTSFSGAAPGGASATPQSVPPTAAESPIPKGWFDQDPNNNNNTSMNSGIPTSGSASNLNAAAAAGAGAGYPQRSQTPTGQPPHLALNSSYSSYYGNRPTPQQPPQQAQPQQQGMSNVVPRPYPNTYPNRSASPAPNHLLSQQPIPPSQQTVNLNYSQSQQTPTPTNPMYGQKQISPYPPPNNATSTYPRRDGSLPPNNRSSSVGPPVGGRDGSLPPNLRNNLGTRRDGSLPPTQRGNGNNTETNKGSSTSNGLIRITLRKPMGIVFEPIPSTGVSTQPQRGVRVCELPRTGAAALSRKLEVGDELLSINETTMSRLTFDEIMDFIIDADPDSVNLLFRRPRKEEMGQRMESKRSQISSGNHTVKWVDENVTGSGGSGGGGGNTQKNNNEPDPNDDDNTYENKKDRRDRDRDRDYKQRAREKMSEKKKSRSRRKDRSDPESLLDLLIDSLCSPLVQEAGPCVNNIKRKKRRGGDDSDSDDETYVSYDSSTYYTYDSSSVPDNHKSNRTAKNKFQNKNDNIEEEDEEDDLEYSVDGSTLETEQERDRRRKEFQKKKFGIGAEEPNTKPNKSKTRLAYEDDATLETVETFERRKNAEDSSYIPQRPLGLGGNDDARLSQVEEHTNENDDDLPNAHAHAHTHAHVPPITVNPNTPFPFHEFDVVDGGDVSVITQSLVDFGGNRGDYSLPGMTMDESIQKSPTKFYRHVVKHLLETHEPEKVRLLDKLLAKYENREEHLIQKLTVRYNRKEEESAAGGNGNGNGNGNNGANTPTINENEPYSDKDSQGDNSESESESDNDNDIHAHGHEDPDLVMQDRTISSVDDDEINQSQSRSMSYDEDGPEYISNHEEHEHSTSLHTTPSKRSQSQSQPQTPLSSRSASPAHPHGHPHGHGHDDTDYDDEEDASHSGSDDGSHSQQSGSVYSDDYSGFSIDGTSPAVIAQVSELLNFVYGKTSVPGQIDRVSTIMRAYEGRESVLLELLETKALIKANTQNEQNQRESAQPPHAPAMTTDPGTPHSKMSGPSINVDGDYGARDDISSVSAGSISRGAKQQQNQQHPNMFPGAQPMDLIESRVENDAVLFRPPPSFANHHIHNHNHNPTSSTQSNIAGGGMGMNTKKQKAVAKVVQAQDKKSQKKKGLFGFLKRGKGKDKKKKNDGSFPKTKKKGGLQSKVDDDGSI